MDYNEHSSNDDVSTTLESPAKLIADQEKPSDKGKGDPEAVTNVGAGTIAKRNAVLTQAIILDLAPLSKLSCTLPY